MYWLSKFNKFIYYGNVNYTEFGEKHKLCKFKNSELIIWEKHRNLVNYTRSTNHNYVSVNQWWDSVMIVLWQSIITKFVWKIFVKKRNKFCIMYPILGTITVYEPGNNSQVMTFLIDTSISKVRDDHVAIEYVLSNYFPD